MSIDKLNIEHKQDSPAKQKLIASGDISTKETLTATEINELTSKTNELVDAYNFGAPITAFNFKTNVPTYADLPLVGNEVNDGYGVIEDGLVYVWNGTAFPPEGDGMNLGLKPNGVVEMGNTIAVSGGEVAKLAVKGVGVGIVNPGDLDYIDFLKGLDRTDFSEESPWGEGYINTSGNVTNSTSYLHTKSYIPLNKGKYKSNLRIDTDTAVFAIYDSDRNFVSWLGSKGSPTSLQDWDFELLEDGFVRFSYAKYYDTNESILKLEDRGIFDAENKYVPTDDVYMLSNKSSEYVNTSLGINPTPIDTNFISTLVDSDIYNTALWAERYLNENGGTANAERFYHTINHYKIPKGKYEYRLYFSSNAKGLLYDPDTFDIVQVLSNTADGQIKLIETDRDLLLRFSHRITGATTRTDLIYWKNVEEIYPTVLTDENIDDFQSNNSIRKVIQDSFKPRIKRKIVSFISDDGYASEHDWFCPLLEEYGIKATLAIVKNWVGNTEQGNMLNENQVIDLDSRGHEIASHTTTHQRMDELTDLEIHDIIGGNKTYLEELLNKPCTTFISPFGIRSGRIDSIVSAYHECNVITGYGHLNNPPIDSFFLNRVSFDLGSGQTSRFPSILQPIIDDSADNDNWLMFAFHTGRREYSSSGTRRQELRDMIDYLLSIGYEFMTVRNAMNYMRNPIEIGVKRHDMFYYRLGMNGVEENGNYFKD